MNSSSFKLIYSFSFAIIKNLALTLSPFFPKSKWSESVRLKKKNEVFINSKSDFKSLSPEDVQRLKPYWIHVSSGEFEYAKPILRHLKTISPHIPILVSFSSPSALPMLQKNAEVDFFQIAPWDQSSEVLLFLTRWNPRSLLIARTDLWPVMISESKKRNIPRLLFSHTFNHPTGSLKGFEKLFRRWSYQNLSSIFVVHEKDQKQLSDQLQIESAIAGDTRYDQVHYRLTHQNQIKNQLKPQTDQVIFIAGSTWPKDEEILLPVLAKRKNMKVILAPHEISEEHMSHLKKNLQSLNIDYGMYSELQAWKNEQVLLIDQIGVLAELYTWAHLAFVGGSFVKKVHSVMEPLAAGLPVLVGPYFDNNREAVEFLQINSENHPLVQSLHTVEDLTQALQKYENLQRDQKFKLRQSIQKQIESRKGATEKVMNWLKSSKV